MESLRPLPRWGASLGTVTKWQSGGGEGKEIFLFFTWRKGNDEGRRAWQIELRGKERHAGGTSAFLMFQGWAESHEGKDALFLSSAPDYGVIPRLL